MYPHERSLVKRLADKPFVLLGVNSDRDRDALKKVMEKEEITWRSWFDGGTGGPIATKWNLSATPTFYMIDHKGVIRYRWAGPPGEKAIGAALHKLIQEAEENGKNLRR